MNDSTHPATATNFVQWRRLDWLLVFLLTALAAALRFYKLGEVPYGFHFDEAYNAIDADLVLRGSRPLFLTANRGREVLYTYWQAFLGSLFGLNLYTLRLASALLGIAAVPITYGLLRVLLRKNSVPIALFTSLTLAASLWHIHFSHYGIRTIAMPVLLSGVFGFFWLGTYGPRRALRVSGYLLSGVFAGLAVWTHPAGRLTPIVLIAYVLWLLWHHPQQRRLRPDAQWNMAWLGLLLTGITAFVVFLPLGIEFYRHPDYFFGHVSEVVVFSERIGGDRPMQLFLQNIVRVLGMFSWRGDLGWTHNLSGRPAFDPLLALFFTAAW